MLRECVSVADENEIEWSHINQHWPFHANGEGKKCSLAAGGTGRMERASVLRKGKGACSALCWEKSAIVHFPLILPAFGYKVHGLLSQYVRKPVVHM